MELHQAQNKIAEDTHRFRVLVCGRKFGKALDIKTPILTTKGWKVLDDIKVGEFIFAPNGKKTKVLYKSPIYYGRKCYEILFRDGSKIIADAEHNWLVENKSFRKNIARNKNTSKRLQKLTTLEISKKIWYGKETNFTIPLTRPLEFPQKNLLIEPYFLGLWLGDGSSRQSTIYSADEEIIEYLYSYAQRLGMKISVENEKDICRGYAIRAKKRGGNNLQKKLHSLNLLKNKHIPPDYLIASIQQREDLLAGLLDSDGYCNEKGYVEFCATNKNLAKQVIELLRGLGQKPILYVGNATLKGKIISQKYRVHFTQTKQFFKLKRKQRGIGKDTSNFRRAIISVNETDSVPVQCLMVEDKSHLFLAGEGLIATHNTELAIEEILGVALSKGNKEIVYLATNYGEARDIAWARMIKRFKPIFASEPNETRLEMRVYAQDKGISQIQLKGWESVENLRGREFDFLVLDEVQNYKNFWMYWQEVLRPTLTPRKGQALFLGTPKGFTHLYDLFNLESSNNDFKSFHFTTYDNPYIPVEEIEKAKLELTEDRFAQEYMADFRKTEGLVYKEFNRKEHLYKEELNKNEIVKVFGGVDFGFVHPAAAIEIKKHLNGKYFVSGEWYKIKQTDAQIADYVSALKWNECYPDPESAGGIEELKRRGVNVREVIKGKDSIRNGINVVRELFKQGRLFIHESCQNLIWEFETYCYEDPKNRKTDEIPVKENDHALDALRYALMMDTAINLPADMQRRQEQQFNRNINRQKLSSTK